MSRSHSQPPGMRPPSSSNGDADLNAQDRRYSDTLEQHQAEDGLVTQLNRAASRSSTLLGRSAARRAAHGSTEPRHRQVDVAPPTGPSARIETATGASPLERIRLGRPPGSAPNGPKLRERIDEARREATLSAVLSAAAGPPIHEDRNAGRGTGPAKAAMTRSSSVPKSTSRLVQRDGRAAQTTVQASRGAKSSERSGGPSGPGGSPPLSHGATGFIARTVRLASRATAAAMAAALVAMVGYVLMVSSGKQTGDGISAAATGTAHAAATAQPGRTTSQANARSSTFTANGQDLKLDRQTAANHNEIGERQLGFTGNHALEAPSRRSVAIVLGTRDALSNVNEAQRLRVPGSAPVPVPVGILTDDHALKISALVLSGVPKGLVISTATRIRERAWGVLPRNAAKLTIRNSAALSGTHNVNIAAFDENGLQVGSRTLTISLDGDREASADAKAIPGTVPPLMHAGSSTAKQLPEAAAGAKIIVPARKRVPNRLPGVKVVTRNPALAETGAATVNSRIITPSTATLQRQAADRALGAIEPPKPQLAKPTPPRQIEQARPKIVRRAPKPKYALGRGTERATRRSASRQRSQNRSDWKMRALFKDRW